MVKKINQNLTTEQKLILFEEGTELAGTSELNHEKRKISLSIKLLEEIQNKEAVTKFSSPLSGKNLPFSTLSDKLKNKDKFFPDRGELNFVTASLFWISSSSLILKEIFLFS
jgi:predicted RNA-binding protein with RPS1 domain